VQITYGNDHCFEDYNYLWFFCLSIVFFGYYLLFETTSYVLGMAL